MNGSHDHRITYEALDLVIDQIGELLDPGDDTIRTNIDPDDIPAVMDVISDLVTHLRKASRDAQYSVLQDAIDQG